MQENWTIVENNFWRRKWFFFRKFDRDCARYIAHRLMHCEPTIIGDERIEEAIIDFLRQNSDRKWSMECPYLCVGMEPAKDPRRFALKLSRCPFPARPRTAQVEWTYDFRPGSKIQGRQIDEHEI